MSHFIVSWSFEVIVEADSKHEAVIAARELVNSGGVDYTLTELAAQDALDVVPCDQDGDPL